jgi:hypothetical protein
MAGGVSVRWKRDTVATEILIPSAHGSGVSTAAILFSFGFDC